MNYGLANADIRYEVLNGAAIQKYDMLLKKWRADFFGEYPYLFQPSNPDVFYDADLSEHVSYESSDKTILVCAFDNATLIGCFIGMPLKDVQAPTDPNVADEWYCPDDLSREMQEKYKSSFHLSELFIDRAYRSVQLAQGLYDHMVQAARKICPECTSLCLVKIDDENDHPLRPQNYEQRMSMERLEYALLINNGFVKTGDYVHTMWTTIQPCGNLRMEQHTVYIWIKELALPC